LLSTPPTLSGSKKFSVSLVLLHHALAGLRTTTQRLGAAAVSSERYAAHKYSNFHSKFMRASAAVAPNRKLCAVICLSVAGKNY
jgi:succinate dehydrogenase/fumarate reductase cytochrome b subunit